MLSDEPLFGNLFVSAYPPFSVWNAESVATVHNRLREPDTAHRDARLGLYVHLPFCEKRCDYCLYLSYADAELRHEDYVAALLAEASAYRQAPALSQRRVLCVYFGGGTPSLLDERHIERLLTGLRQSFSWDGVEEVTFECAPRSVTESKLRLLHNAGVTRISLGVQSLDDEVLRTNGRVHLTRDVDAAYTAIRRVGFPVVNLDLMVGLPGESDETVTATLERVIHWAPESVTVYQLEIPLNTRLYRQATQDADERPIPGWPTKRARLGRCFGRLEQAGYVVRSAYAAVRDPTRHRFLYQDAQYGGGDLLGIGVASFSYLGGLHFQNRASYRAYREDLAAGRLPLERARALTKEEKWIREFVLRLKLGQVALEDLRRKYGVDVAGRLADPLAELAELGYLTIERGDVRLTREGLLRVDRLLPAFYLPEHCGVRYS